jgi:hypothetical protein
VLGREELAFGLAACIYGPDCGLYQKGGNIFGRVLLHCVESSSPPKVSVPMVVSARIVTSHRLAWLSASVPTACVRYRWICA